MITLNSVRLRSLLSKCGHNLFEPVWKHYSLFHQILGVAFFQFAQSLFKNFEKIFFRIILSSCPSIPENLVDFFSVLAKLKANFLFRTILHRRTDCSLLDLLLSENRPLGM